jgi:hypothetical protein
MWRSCANDDSTRSKFCLAIPLVLFALGCSNSNTNLAEVTGEVTFEGQPAPAEIIFEPSGPSGGRVSNARAGDDGRFKLTYTEDEDGAVIGTHHVVVRVFSPNKTQSFQDVSSPIKTARLEREVKPGSNYFRFALTY